MVTRRTAKVKGNAFEYDCQASLKAFAPDIYRTAERGFQRQYDLRSDAQKCVFECKRLKALSWNQAKKYFLKLAEIACENTPYLLFKSNQQPCLVMYYWEESITVCEFEDYFGVPFVKHESTRRKKDDKKIQEETSSD